MKNSETCGEEQNQELSHKHLFISVVKSHYFSVYLQRASGSDTRVKIDQTVMSELSGMNQRNVVVLCFLLFKLHQKPAKFGGLINLVNGVLFDCSAGVKSLKKEEEHTDPTPLYSFGLCL